jgi:hypothetical protein
LVLLVIGRPLVQVSRNRWFTAEERRRLDWLVVQLRARSAGEVFKRATFDFADVVLVRSPSPTRARRRSAPPSSSARPPTIGSDPT